jgi:two-component system, OmpR family, sensor histidine kinase BaeS
LQSMAVSAFWGTVATVGIALLIGIWFSRRLTSPLQHMLSAISKIIHGDLKARLPIVSADEFGQVAQAFNEMTKRLYRTEEARQHLVADVAHELRTPLTIMQGQLELIQQGVKQAEPATLLPIQDEVLRLTGLVQDLHQLSLAEIGKLPLDKKPTNILELIKRVMSNFEIESEEREVTVCVQTHIAENTTLHIDPNRITQVFVNLLGNALHHTPSGGSVTINLSESVAENVLEISVQDTGSGIPKEHVPFIFNRFYRAEEDRSRGTGGLGLGLAIAKEFVEAHNGRIEVESALGRGTKFTVFLPKE